MMEHLYGPHSDMCLCCGKDRPFWPCMESRAQRYVKEGKTPLEAIEQAKKDWDIYQEVKRRVRE